jgi:hypothetical protein
LSENRLVTSQLESRWNAKLEELTQLQDQLQAMQNAVTPLSETDRQMIMTLGRHFRQLWFSDACSMTLKKKIMHPDPGDWSEPRRGHAEFNLHHSLERWLSYHIVDEKAAIRRHQV